MQIDRRAFATGLGGLALSTIVPGLARSQQLENPSIRLGVANKAHLYYLPVTLAERRGHFKDYGLNVAITDFEGGAQSLDALLAGTVDVVTGAYEHTLRSQAKGQDIRALIELGRFPGIVLAVRKDAPLRSHADLKGMKIGVTAPGSSTHFLVLYLMAKAGLGPTDATFVGVGGGLGGCRRDEARGDRRDFEPRSGHHPLAGGRGHPHRHGHPLSARELPGIRRHQSGGCALRQAGVHRRQPEHDPGAGECVLQDPEVDRDRHDRRDRQ